MLAERRRANLRLPLPKTGGFSPRFSPEFFDNLPRSEPISSGEKCPRNSFSGDNKPKKPISGENRVQNQAISGENRVEEVLDSGINGVKNPSYSGEIRLRNVQPSDFSGETRRGFPLPLPPGRKFEVERLSDLERLGVLGHGNGGTVYKARHKRTGTIYALKVLHSEFDPPARRQMVREMEILKKTDSPHVVKCHGIFEKFGDISLVLEFMGGGTLDEVFRRANGSVSEQFISGICRQVLEGLAYLHDQKIVHRDLKPTNILVNRKLEVKIADFGVSRIMCRTLDPCDSYVGTCAYMSPERFDPDSHGGNYSGYAGDIWSLGLTIMELYMGRFPFLKPGQRPDWPTLMMAICFGELPKLPDEASSEFGSFVGCCLQKDSSRRWTARQLLGHPFITKHGGLASKLQGLSLS
ncbi:hypothetical protein AMTRI_Chr04g244470 [Amborella trichopoda]|uniref:mitogen-activated protein kinase kinase n=1 Tax=Amborella trichopoda TaxID=13333 RepID=W1PMW5_AMBTC|nr:mitogen-activated protein kinase kinase 9 [Amborella trichopoda]ERN11362.1 hypothetical protein AMTR_s00176p00017140 [Amborella trichopoda]|eukprot:XP_006849781.1 mitogen-activated protein kinase kinase 9 [Amborella trichopoda]